YEYDAMLRLVKVTENGDITTYTYDANGNRASMTMPGGVITAYTYNDANLVTKLTNKVNGATVSEFTYTYYTDGNQRTKTDTVNNIMTTYVYDGAGRLTSETEFDTVSAVIINRYQYTYDSANNRATMTQDGTEVKHVVYTYDKNNRLLSETLVSETSETVGVQTNVAYDGNKKITTITETNIRTITEEVINAYTYNPDGLRRLKHVVLMLEQRYIWSGSSMVYECELLYPNNGTVYVYGINLISSRNSTGNSTFYLYNAHGDVVQLVDGAGDITQTYNYDAFGVEYDVDEDDDNLFRYCAEYFDKETGTIYLRARYYNPENGRFTSEDPIGAGLNWYIYSNGNPIYFTDSSGLDPYLDQYIEENYLGKVTITFVVMQPVPGSRQAIDNDMSGDVGHTFIRLDFGDGRVYYFGFYPKDPLSVEQILKKEDVSWVIINDSDHDWNIAEVYVIDIDSANNVLEFINNYDMEYNMASNNCTTFAVDVLKAAGISSPTKAVKWTLPSKAKKMVQDGLGGGFINGIKAYFAIKIKGYSPADAGEDLRERSTAIIKSTGSNNQPCVVPSN
ncbi:MAG TPA: RHS repeat-associated core domain-containing protein, partial [Bacillales bacterium]|nr:RHS repeat-associated core domain-containing protein [Bacillales bacterium]